MFRILLPHPLFHQQSLCSERKAVESAPNGGAGQQFFCLTLRNLPSAMAHDRFMIFTGTANTRLAVDVANHLDMSLGKMTVGRFSDGEVLEIGRASCRARVCRYV